jgi:hypothetical protein
MTYEELQAEILSEAHRPDLAGDRVQRFIRECEGLIRRELLFHTLRVTLDETDRASEGLYTLPQGFMVMRRVLGVDSAPVDQVGIDAIRSYPATAPLLQYAVHDHTTVEFRGVPAEDAEIPIVYIGHPEALEGDDDTNTLLEEHESLYLRGALFFLYTHTQDRELAKDSLDIFNGVIEQLNERASRTTGGGTTAGAYNFSGRSAR